MSRSLSRTALCTLTCLACGLLISGCANLRQDYADKSLYVTQPVRKAEPRSSSTSAILSIPRFMIAPVCETKEMTYRTTNYRYERDYYNTFAVTPDLMVTEQCARWVSESGLVEGILLRGQRAKPTHVLYGTILAFNGDFRLEGFPKAEVEIAFVLTDESEGEPKVLMQDRYRVETPMPRKSAEALAAALTQSLETVFAQLEEDLASTEILENAAESITY